MINKKNKKFADSYVDSAIVQKEIIRRLIQRLSFINISPERILDIGSGIGLGTEKLFKHYSQSEYFMLDKSFQSLNSGYINNKNISMVSADFKNICLNVKS
mgnify:CR=1 FL=1